MLPVYGYTTVLLIALGTGFLSRRRGLGPDDLCSAPPPPPPPYLERDGNISFPLKYLGHLDFFFAV
jgi:hypothetical protein